MAVAVVVTLLKLVLSFHVYGVRAEMPFWMRFGEEIEQQGALGIYGVDEFFNHPPLAVAILKLVMAAKAWTGLEFPFLFRLVPILSDLALVILVLRLLEGQDARTRLLVGLLCAASPIHFLVSAYQGNTDPLLVLLLASCALALRTGRDRAGGLLYGSSLCLKLAPVMLGPFLLFRPAPVKQKLVFFSIAAAVVVLTFLPFYGHDPSSFSRNVLQYSSISGTWGIGRVLVLLNNDESLSPAFRKACGDVFLWYIDNGKWLVLGGLGALFVGGIDRKKIDFLEGAFLSFAVFLFLAPGFGLQYLTWIACSSVIVLRKLGTLYNVLGGIYLVEVYASEGGALPGHAIALEIGLWLLVGVMTCVFIAKKRRSPPRA